MIDDPVAYASSISAQPNSCEDHSTISSPSLDRCTPSSAAAKQNSAAKSRSLTASIELAAAESKPSTAATVSGSSGSDEPASAPAPSGLTAARLSQSRSLPTSRQNAWTCASSWWANSTGWACCRCVIPGTGVPDCRSAWPISAVSSSASREVISRAWSRKYSRRSVAIWSLRLRPARSLPPSAPTRSSSPRSRAVCTSSSPAVGRKLPARHACPRSSSAASRRVISMSVSSPALCSTRACALDASRSYGASRQSNWTLTDSRVSASAGPDSNRPPQSLIEAPGLIAEPASLSATALPPRAWSWLIGSAGSIPGLAGRPAVRAGRDLAGQAPELDEAPGQVLVEDVTGVIGGQPVVVQPGRAAAAGDHCPAAVQAEPDVAGDMPGRLVHEGLKRAAQRGEPQPVVDELGPALPGLPLEPREVALQADVLKFSVRGDQRDGARRLVDLPALDPDEPVLDQVDPADAVRARALVQLGDDLQRAELALVDRHRGAVGEAHHDLI